MRKKNDKQHFTDMEMEKQEKTNNIVVEKFVQTRKKENRDLKKKS